MKKRREQRLPVNPDGMTKGRRSRVKLNPWFMPQEAHPPARKQWRQREIERDSHS